MKKIWTKGGVITNKTVEDYTVGVDYLLDLHFAYDIKGSLAQAKMLHKMKILSKKSLIR